MVTHRAPSSVPEVQLGPKPQSAPEPQSSLLEAVVAWIAAWQTVCRVCYRAAVAHQQPFRLNPANFGPPIITRTSLARDITGFDVIHHPDW